MSLGVLAPILVLCKSMESRYLFRSRFSVNVILLFHKIFSEQPIFKLCSKYDKPKITNNLLILQKFKKFSIPLFNILNLLQGSPG